MVLTGNVFQKNAVVAWGSRPGHVVSEWTWYLAKGVDYGLANQFL